MVSVSDEAIQDAPGVDEELVEVPGVAADVYAAIAAAIAASPSGEIGAVVIPDTGVPEIEGAETEAERRERIRQRVAAQAAEALAAVFVNSNDAVALLSGIASKSARRYELTDHEQAVLHYLNAAYEHGSTKKFEIEEADAADLEDIQWLPEGVDLIPGNYDIEIYQGDSYGPLVVTLPSLASFGGPPDLSGVGIAVTAQIRPKANSGTLLAEFDVEITDPTDRVVTLSMSAPTTDAITRSGVWDLQVENADGTWTPLAGKVKLIQDVTP